MEHASGSTQYRGPGPADPPLCLSLCPPWFPLCVLGPAVAGWREHGVGESSEVCAVRGVAVLRPVRAALHHRAPLRPHRGEGEDVDAAPRRRPHGLLADRGVLRGLRDHGGAAGLGAHEVHGVQEEEGSVEEEVVSASLTT